MRQLNDLSLDFFKKHFFFLFLFTNYIVALILFGEFTLFYIDKFDNEIVYNYILGDFYRGNEKASEILLNGEVKINWFRRLLQPFSLLYIFNYEFAFWTIDIINKLISYFCFYIFSKKIIKNNFISSLCSFFFASINDDSIHGFLIAFFPYFTYLLLFKEKIKKKHFFLIIFCALNTELVYSIYFSFFLFFLLIIFNKINFLSIKNLLTISIVLYFFVILSNFNIIYAFLFDGPFHRDEIVSTETLNIKSFLNSFFSIPWKTNKFFSYELAHGIPVLLFNLFFFPLIFFCKKKEIYILFLFWFFLSPIIYLIKLIDIKLFKFWNPEYYIFYNVFVYGLLSLLILKAFKFSSWILIAICFISEINSSLIPFAKNNIDYFKVNNYRNYYTFKDYYLKETYSKIKEIVKDDRVMSLYPADPLVAVMSKIKTIDGEHNLYPLSYKKKFYKIIKNELEDNKELKSYYLDWGHRVYAFVNDPKNIKINFSEANKIGAKYVISKYPVKNKDLKKIIEIENKEKIFLYKIIK